MATRMSVPVINPGVLLADILPADVLLADILLAAMRGPAAAQS
jgi:hypothetical protein